MNKEVFKTKEVMESKTNQKYSKKEQVRNEVIQYYVMNKQFEVFFAHKGYSDYLLEGMKNCNLNFPEGEVLELEHDGDEQTWFSSSVDSLHAVGHNEKKPIYANLEMTMREYIEMLHDVEMCNYLNDIEMCSYTI